MITIEKMRTAQIEGAKRVRCECIREIVFGRETPLEDVRRRLESEGGLLDYDNVQREYFENGGTFLVILDDGKVVGTGGIRQLNPQICELRRMFILKEYRGRGLGTRLLEELLHFARQCGHTAIRLNTVSRMADAVKFYERRGFRHIEQYREVTYSDVFMEKIL